MLLLLHNAARSHKLYKNFFDKKKYDVHPCPAVKNTYLHIGYIIHIVAKEKKIETKHTYLHTYYIIYKMGIKERNRLWHFFQNLIAT